MAATEEHHIELDAKLLEDTDDEADEEDEEAKNAILIEKSKDQIREEESQRWAYFIYPSWAAGAIYVLFVCCLVNLILTLEQEHVSHGWNRPFDLYPSVQFRGGWGDQGKRWGGAILSITASGMALAWIPTSFKYKMLSTFLFIGATLLIFQFGSDLQDLYDARDYPECQGALDNQSRKFRCEFDRFRATAVMGIVSSVFSYFLCFFMVYQVINQIVSHKQVYNERTNQWEKYTLTGDEPFYNAFPKAYKKQRYMFAGLCVFVLACNASLIALSGTQTTTPYANFRNSLSPVFNYNKNIPRDVYVITGNQPAGIGRETGRGGWPEVNFTLRLSVNALALVVLAFLIQWRRDGRSQQLYVLVLLLAAGIIFTGSLFIDLEELDDVIDLNDDWARAQGSEVAYHRYYATVIFDGFCAFGLMLFSLANLAALYGQSKKPVHQTEVHPYGWWCFGEWEAEKKKKESAKQFDEQF